MSSPWPEEKALKEVALTDRDCDAALPPSLVNMGWEFPATNIIPDQRPSHRPGRSQARAHSSEREGASPEPPAQTVQQPEVRAAIFYL